MNSNLLTVWNALRGIIREAFTFTNLKEIAGTSGLPVHRLSHLQQKQLPEKGASKSHLLDAIDDLIKEQQDPEHTILLFINEALRRKKTIHEDIENSAQQFGWHITGDALQTADLHVKGSTEELSQDIKQLLRTAYERYMKKDYAGAMTAVCSAVDTLTNEVYKTQTLGNPNSDSYQQRANRAFASLEVEYKKRLKSAGIDNDEIVKIWSNHKGAVNQAAYVLGSLRRNASDVHGLKNCTPELVRIAIDCGTFISRSIAATLGTEE